MLDAGVVDQDVDAAHRAHGVGHHLGDLLGLAHVGGVVAELRVDALELGARRVDIAKTIEHDVGPMAGQHLGDAQADAAGGTGDQCDLAREHVRAFVWLVASIIEPGSAP